MTLDPTDFELENEEIQKEKLIQMEKELTKNKGRDHTSVNKGDVLFALISKRKENPNFQVHLALDELIEEVEAMR